jgi:uncharacterized membrane protein
MTSIARFVEVFALGTWVGGIVFLSFVVAPGAFGILGNRDQAGMMVGYSLGRLHWIGMVLGLIYLVAYAVDARSIGALARPVALAVILMVGLTFFSQQFVTGRMAGLRREMVSVDATARENPLRAEFDRLHVWSVRIESAVLLIGLVGIFLTVREIAAPRS